MDRTTVSGSSADSLIHRHVQVAALTILVLFAVIAWALESSILLPAQWLAEYDSLKSSLNVWSTAHLSSGVLPLARSLANIALSPLPYLGFAAVFLAERFAPADGEQRPLSRGLIHDGLAWFLINAPLSAFAYTGTLGLLYLALNRYTPFLRIDREITGLMPTWILIAAAVVVSDLMKWIHHYVTHKTTILWHFHSVHHSQRELNLFTQARFHAGEVVTLPPIMALPLFVLNLDFGLAVWIVLAIEWYSRITHANLRTNFGPLRHLLVTPQSHRIHHSRDSRHHDQNFGTLFSFWDRLFGTQWPDHEEYPATGIADESFPLETSVSPTSVLANYFAQLVYPFQRIARSRRDPDGES